LLALYNFLPLYCPSCGPPTRLDRADSTLAGKFKAKQADVCTTSGIIYQLADKSDILRAATASCVDMIEFFLDEDDQADEGKLN
jgi:hypothetical protein